MLYWLKLIMAMSILIGASSNLKAQDFVMSGIEVSDAIAKCEAGDADLCNEVAWSYLLNSVENRSLANTAVDYFAKACFLGKSQACHDGGIYLSFSPEMAEYFGILPDFDLGVKLFENGCGIQDHYSSLNCTELALFYFDGRYASITLEQAYRYAMVGCDESSSKSCYALYSHYPKIASFANVPSKFSLLFRAKALDLQSVISMPPPPPPPGWEG